MLTIRNTKWNILKTVETTSDSGNIYNIVLKELLWRCWGTSRQLFFIGRPL